MSNHAIQLRQRVETIMPDLVITHLELNQEGLINDYAQSIELQWVLLESVSEIGRGSLTASWRSFFCVVGAKVGGWKQKMGPKASQRRKK